MAWNYYPPISEDQVNLPPRLHGHADMDVITLLHQRPGDIGLEIAPGKDVSLCPTAVLRLEKCSFKASAKQSVCFGLRIKFLV